MVSLLLQAQHEKTGETRTTSVYANNDIGGIQTSTFSLPQRRREGAARSTNCMASTAAGTERTPAPDEHE